MKIAIVGSRNFPSPEKIRKYMQALPKDTIIVSGGAPGVDLIAEKLADELGLQKEIYHADWNNLSEPDALIKTNKYGKKYDARAGHRRNSQIVQAADKIVAFWDGKSTGTQDTIKKANLSGKPCHVVKP